MGSAQPQSQSRRRDRPKLTIEQFQIKNKVGAGTFGVIVRAEEKASRREYALKIMDKGQIQSREHASHIVREKNVLMYLSEPGHTCPFIVQAHNSFHDRKSVYIQMDFVRGCDLLSRIRANELMVKINMHFYAAEVLCALEHMHAHRIVYRDLKPEHVMIDTDGHCQIVDFGFAKRFTEKDEKRNQCRTFTNCGTPDYIAPEVLKGTGASYKADIWSLGVLICEILTG